MKRNIVSTERIILAVAAVAALLVSLACSSSATPTAAPAAPTATLAPNSTATAVPTATKTVVPTPTVKAVAAGPQYGGNLRYVGNVNPDTMDPNQSNEFIGRYIYYMIYNSLVKYAPDFSLEPELSKSWDISADGKKVTFRLQQGVKFDDGSEFDANTVLWNFHYLADQKNQSKIRTTLSNDVASVEVVDKYTVVYNLKNPLRSLLSFLGERSGFMLNPKAVEQWGGGPTGQYGRHPSGTGAFVMSEWTIGSRFVVTKNSKYWETGKPYLDKVTMLNVPDYTVNLAMLRTGEADIMDGMRNEDRKLVVGNPDVKVIEHKSGRYYGIRISVDRVPWDNKTLRAAIAYAIDRQTVIDAVWGGAGRIAYTPEAANWAEISDKIYAFDPAMARQKLKEAGYPNGITFNYWCTTETLDYVSAPLCESIQAMLSNVGIKTNIVVVPASDYFNKQVNRETHFNHTSFAPRADPDGRLWRVFHTGGASNVNGYSNPEVDKLLDEAAKLYDITKAKEIYTKAQRIIAEDAGTVFLRYSNEYAVLRSNVQDFVYIPDLILRFRELWFKQ